MVSTCLVVMGVSGAGKSTVASELAVSLGWTMAEADEFHPTANVHKMAAGTPLTDNDRGPWLRALRDWITRHADQDGNTVVACSALKRSYRDILRTASARVRFVHLRGDAELITNRLGARSGHFMPPALLDSQFGDLEELADDEDGVSIDLRQPPEVLADTALTLLGLAASPERPG